MNKFILFIISMVLPVDLYAATSDIVSKNAIYWKKLIDLTTVIVLDLALIIALFLLIRLSIVFVQNLFRKDVISQNGLKPMSTFKFFMGIILAFVIAKPLYTMDFFNDLSGLSNADKNLGVCLVANITGNNVGWVDRSQECLSKLNEKALTYGKLTGSEQVSSINLGLMFGLLQLIMLGFFIISGIFIFMHILGYRDVKVSVSKAIMSMIISSALMSAPSMVDYAVDFMGESNAIF